MKEVEEGEGTKDDWGGRGWRRDGMGKEIVGEWERTKEEEEG